MGAVASFTLLSDDFLCKDRKENQQKNRARPVFPFLGQSSYGAGHPVWGAFSQRGSEGRHVPVWGVGRMVHRRPFEFYGDWRRVGGRRRRQGGEVRPLLKTCEPALVTFCPIRPDFFQMLGIFVHEKSPFFVWLIKRYASIRAVEISLFPIFRVPVRFCAILTAAAKNYFR